MATNQFTGKVIRWIFLGLGLLSALALYGYFFYVEEWTSWLTIIISALPGLIIILLVITIVLNSMVNKTKKALISVLSGIAATLITYYIWSDKIKEWVEEAQKDFIKGILAGICISIIGLFTASFKKNGS